MYLLLHEIIFNYRGIIWHGCISQILENVIAKERSTATEAISLAKLEIATPPKGKIGGSQ
jgi:hypothetical protein